MGVQKGVRRRPVGRGRSPRQREAARTRKAATRSAPRRAAAKGFSIASIHAREILDSRGNPTVEAEVTLASGALGRAAVPSGASTGKHEALELRDGTKPYGGKGVMKAVTNVNVAIARRLKGMDARDQRAVDAAMLALDGTPNKARLGANAILAVSLAVCRAAARALGLADYEHLCTLTGQKPVLPMPFANVINGGKHAEGKLKLQEFMIVPTGARTFSEAVQMLAETYQFLKRALHEKYGAGATHVGDEGGFAPPLSTPEETLDLLVATIRQAGYAKRMMLALDPAVSGLYDGKAYDFGEGRLAPEEAIRYWMGLTKSYPILSLEDPFAEDDDLSWRMLADDMHKERRPFQLVGDDLTVTNTARIQKAIDEGLCNALLLKVNQVGTLSEALDAATLARAAGWNVMVSHRSGETEDPFIADLAVALGCGQIKIGAPCRGERTAKYNRLLRIEERLGRSARFPRFALPKA